MEFVFTEISRLLSFTVENVSDLPFLRFSTNSTRVERPLMTTTASKKTDNHIGKQS